MTNKIVSLKLRFQQNFEETLGLPRNAFILVWMEFLLLYGEQNYQMAIATLDEIEHFIELHPSDFERKLFTLLILTLGAQVNLQINNFNKVENLARRILQSAVKMDDPYFQSVALNLITTVLINKGEFRKAQKMMGAALVPAEETGLATDRASLLNNAAKLELARGDYEKSVKLLEQMYELVSAIPRAQAVSAINIAELNILLGNDDKAQEMLETALLLDKSHDLNLMEPYLLSAWIAIEKNKPEEAQSFIDICHKRLDETGETRKIPNISYFQGLLHKRKGETDVAIEYFEKTNKAASEHKNIELLIKAQFQLANVYLERFNETKELADYSSILRYLDNLSYISEEQFIPRLMCDLYLLRGMILAQGGKRERAVKDLEKAYNLASDFNYKRLQKEASTLLKAVEEDKKTADEELKELEEKGFEDIEKMSDVLQKYEGFKFIKSPKRVDTKIQGIAVVEAETGVIRYRYITEHEEDLAASLVPSVVAAVNIFSKTVFEEAMIHGEIKEEGKELLIEPIEDLFVVIIAEKITFSLKLQFEKYVDELKLKSKQLIKIRDDKTLNMLNETTKKYFEDVSFQAGLAEPVPDPGKIEDLEKVEVEEEVKPSAVGVPERREDLDLILGEVEAELEAIQKGEEIDKEAIEKLDPDEEIEKREKIIEEEVDEVSEEIKTIPKPEDSLKTQEKILEVEIDEVANDIVEELEDIVEELEEDIEEIEDEEIKEIAEDIVEELEDIVEELEEDIEEIEEEEVSEKSSEVIVSIPEPDDIVSIPEPELVDEMEDIGEIIAEEAEIVDEKDEEKVPEPEHVEEMDPVTIRDKDEKKKKIVIKEKQKIEESPEDVIDVLKAMEESEIEEENEEEEEYKL
jgi:tetratricopeptide (TPR) repeat protein